MKKKTILPISSPSFKHEIKILFSLPDNKFAKLFPLLEKKLENFSTASIKKTLEIDSDSASSIRRIIIFIVYRINEQNKKLIDIQKELISIDCDSKKVKKFLVNTKKITKNAITACTKLFEIDNYFARMDHLDNIGFEINHTYLTDKFDKMTPILRLTISTVPMKKEKQIIQVDMSANSFEYFIMALEECRESLIKEIQNLKKILGPRYVGTIGE